MVERLPKLPNSGSSGIDVSSFLLAYNAVSFSFRISSMPFLKDFNLFISVGVTLSLLVKAKRPGDHHDSYKF